jgi:hypothetical protein
VGFHQALPHRSGNSSASLEFGANVPKAQVYESSHPVTEQSPQNCTVGRRKFDARSGQTCNRDCSEPAVLLLGPSTPA